MRPLGPLHQRGLLPRVPAAAGHQQHLGMLPSSCGGLSSSSSVCSSCSSSSSRRPIQAWAGPRQGHAGSSGCSSRHAAPHHPTWGHTYTGMAAVPPTRGMACGRHGLQHLVAAAAAGRGRHPSSPVVAAADATPAPAATSSSSPPGQVLVSVNDMDLSPSEAATLRSSTSSSSSSSKAGSRESSTDSNSTAPHASSSSSSQQNEPRPPRSKPKRRSKQQQQQQSDGEGDTRPPELTTVEPSRRQQRLDENTRQQLALLEERRVQQAERDAGRGTNWQPLQGSAEDDQQQWGKQQDGSDVPPPSSSSSSSSSKKGSRFVADRGPATSTSKQQQQQVKKQAPSSSTSSARGQGPGAAVLPPVASAPLSPLHWDIKDFAAAVVPTQDELSHKKEIIQMVQRCVHSLDVFDRGSVRVAPFGSFVSGLGTWDSDIDLVITGLLEPDRVTGGFAPADKRKVVKLLQQVANRMRKLKKLGIRTLSIIPHARIPLVKAGTRSGVNVDISLGDGSGPSAANFVRQQMAAYAPLAPLVVTLKVFLRAAGLNEVANGGLSSFSLTNMVLAHLQEDLKAGQDIYDLGESLYGFFCRYGDEFDYDSEAVSVASGGIVRREALSWAAGDGRLTGDVRLAINDPLTGRDVSAGTYRMGEVRIAFAKAARRLEAMVASSGGGSSSRVNYLACLFDPARAVDRRHGSSKGAVVVGGRPAGLQDLSFQDPDSLLYEELDITGDEDQLDDWAQGSWVGAGGRRR